MKTTNPRHVAAAFSSMEAEFPRLYRAIEWGSGYAFSREPNAMQAEFFRFAREERARGVAEGLERAARMLESMRDDSVAVARSSDEMGRRDIADFARAECSAFGRAVARIRALTLMRILPATSPGAAMSATCGREFINGGKPDGKPCVKPCDHEREDDADAALCIDDTGDGWAFGSGVGREDAEGIRARNAEAPRQTCANCGRAFDGDSDHCAECDEMFEAGVEAAVAAMQTLDARDAVVGLPGGCGDAMRALAEHVRRAVKR